MPGPHPHPLVLELLAPASQRLVRTVDELTDADWTAPSLLPGWSRAHVVAHLALNAEALAGALRGIGGGEQVPMYPSPGSRDDDIDRWAVAAPDELRASLLASVTHFSDALALVPPEEWGRRLERTPGGPTFLAAAVPEMRLREIEIHHADLATSYTRTDWPAEFVVLLLDGASRRDVSETGFLARATDLDRSWTFGTGGPTVSGTGADLAWWITGRGEGEGLTSEGELPKVGAW